MSTEIIQLPLGSVLRSFGHLVKENRSIGRAAMAAVLLIAAAGCSSTIEAGRIGYGKRPVAALLETTLKLGVSTKAQVKDALGEPNGPGGIYLPIDEKPREIWSYNYEESGIESGKRGREIALKSVRTYLFVYFDKGVYDGYMWFSSVPRERLRK